MGEIGERNPELCLASGQYPSVTRVLDMVPKPFLIPWAAKVQREGAVLQDGTTTHNYQDVTNQSRTLGTMIHKLVASRLAKTMPPALPDGPLSEAAYRSLAIFDEQFVLSGEVLAVETMISSDTLGLIGIPDLIVKTTDGLMIVDWKSSPNLYPETRLELAGYALLASEYYNLPVIYMQAFRLDYNEGATFNEAKDLLTIDDYGPDAVIFQHLLKAFLPLQTWLAKHHT